MATAPRRARSRPQGDEQPTPVPQDTPHRSAPSDGVRSVEPRPRGTNGPSDEGEAVVAHLPKSKYRLIERPTGWDVVATDYSESFT